jgi:hypothetical protein
MCQIHLMPTCTKLVLLCDLYFVYLFSVALYWLRMCYSIADYLPNKQNLLVFSFSSKNDPILKACLVVFLALI